MFKSGNGSVWRLKGRRKGSWFCTEYKTTLVFKKEMMLLYAVEFRVKTLLPLSFFATICILMFTRWEVEAVMDVYHICNSVCLSCVALLDWSDQGRLRVEHWEVKNKNTRTWERSLGTNGYTERYSSPNKEVMELCSNFVYYCRAVKVCIQTQLVFSLQWKIGTIFYYITSLFIRQANCYGEKWY